MEEEEECGASETGERNAFEISFLNRFSLSQSPSVHLLCEVIVSAIEQEVKCCSCNRLFALSRLSFVVLANRAGNIELYCKCLQSN